jgi:ethanolamine utilization protein EutN
MLQAVVVGSVWSTRRIDGLPAGAFLEVEVTGSGDRLVAFDVLGTGIGERVLVAQGSVASGWLPDRPPVDALIIGSIDEPGPVTATTGTTIRSTAKAASRTRSGTGPRALPKGGRKRRDPPADGG